MVKTFKNYSQAKTLLLKGNIIARYTIFEPFRIVCHPLDSNMILLLHNEKELADYWTSYDKNIIDNDLRIYNCKNGYKMDDYIFNYAHSIDSSYVCILLTGNEKNYLEIYMFNSFIMLTTRKMAVYENHIGLHRYENNWRSIKNEISTTY